MHHHHHTTGGTAWVDPEKLNVPAAKLPHLETKQDFRESMHWRVFRIMSEIVDGFQYIADFERTVTIFGSTRFSEDNRWYKEAQKLGGLLSKKGYAIVTGGGPGIMEAANRGAADAGGASVGLNIQLPREQRTNPYVNTAVGFHYFFTRKLMLTYSAEAFVYFPGGFGTLDEFFEIITLIQTKKIECCTPVVLVGKEYWEPLIEWMKKSLLESHQAIDKEDLEIFKIVDSADEAVEVIGEVGPKREGF